MYMHVCVCVCVCVYVAMYILYQTALYRMIQNFGGTKFDEFTVCRILRIKYWRIVN